MPETDPANFRPPYRHMKHIATIYLAASLTAFAGTSAPSVEETITQPASEPSEWSVRTSLYGWAQSLDGDVTVRSINLPIDLKFKDIAENLDMAAMGFVEINHGRWGFLLDANYADISDSVSTPHGVVAPSVDFNQKQWLVNGFLTYNVIQNESTVLDVFGGARFNAIKIDLGINKKDFSRDATWVDPIIGLRYQQMVGTSLFFRAAGDIGGFGAASDFTWEAMAGFGWKFNQTCSALATYRVIGTDYSHDGFGYDVTSSGPAIGVELSF